MSLKLSENCDSQNGITSHYCGGVVSFYTDTEHSSFMFFTHMFPGPCAVGQVVGVQNSHSALENRFTCLKKVTAVWKKTKEEEVK